MKKLVFSLILLLALCYVTGGVLLYMAQRSFIYFPTPYVSHDYDDIIVNNDGVGINVVVVNPGKKRALIYFGGNAEAVASNAAQFAQAFDAYTLYLVNYRGYGGSAGQPTEAAIYADAKKVLAHVQDQHTLIDVMGRSLGSGVATYLAALPDSPVRRLVLITPYDSVLSVAQRRFPFYPIRKLLKDQYLSADRAATLTQPVYVIMVEYDRVVPNWHTLNLVAHFSHGNVQMRTITGATHNNVVQGLGELPQIRAFLSEH